MFSKHSSHAPVDYLLTWGVLYIQGNLCSILYKPWCSWDCAALYHDDSAFDTGESAQNIGTACAELLRTALHTIRTVAHVVVAFPGVQYGPFFYRQTEHDRALALKANKGNVDAHMQLSQRATDDLHWWANNVTHCCKPISQGNPDVTRKSDAPNSGWGDVFGSRLAKGRWTEDESEHHINFFELLAAFFTIEAYNLSVRR